MASYGMGAAEVILDGERGTPRDIVVFTRAAGVLVSGVLPSLEAGSAPALSDSEATLCYM
jgi:hypothetical protein